MDHKRPRTPLIFGLQILPFPSFLLSAFLFVSSSLRHILPLLFLPPPPPRLLSVFLSAVLLLVFRHISPFVWPLLILLPLRLFHFPASSFDADSDELEGQASPPFFVD